MTAYQINNPEMYDAIRAMFFEVIGRADALDLPIDNVIIRLRSDMAEALELGEYLTLAYPYTPSFNVPIVRDDTIESRSEAGGYKSDIQIYSPDWLETE